MKTRIIPKLMFAIGLSIFTALTAGRSSAHAESDFDSLGSNESILKRARSLNTEQQVQIVQKRSVDRDLRFEIGASYGGSVGGNSLLNTQPTTGNVEFHVNPKFSIGARYSQYASQLTKEGKAQSDSAHAAQASGSPFTVPSIDVPKSSILGTVSYYPMYGKLNFFDLTVVQFDIYVLGGYGQMEMESGTNPTWTAGGGIGFWWNKHISSRLEIRQQGYQDRVGPVGATSTRDVGLTIGTLGIGMLF